MAEDIRKVIDRIVNNPQVQVRYRRGDSFRLKHKYKTNGTVCTEDSKDPALIVTRTKNGWVYYCHRCHFQGYLPDSGMSPKETAKRVKLLSDHAESRVQAKIVLPYDFINLRSESENLDEIPWDAYHHIWQYGITGEDITDHNLGWSPAYNRVIFPLYEYSLFGDTKMRKLVGWAGRDPDWKKGDKNAKWITRSEKGERRYFTSPGDEDTVVIVEDAISAIKVNRATGYTTVALLNAAISDNLCRKLRGKKIYLWLDGDMLAESLLQVQRMRQLGLDARHIYTPRDPKTYNSVYINSSLKGGDNECHKN